MQEKKIDISLDGNTSMLVLNAWLDSLQEQDRESYILLINSRYRFIHEKKDILTDYLAVQSEWRKIGFKIPMSEEQKERFAKRLFNSISACDIIPSLENDPLLKFNEYIEDDFLAVFCEKYEYSNKIPVINITKFVYLFDRMQERNIIAHLTSDKHNLLEDYFKNGKRNIHFNYSGLKSNLSKSKKKLNDAEKKTIDDIIDDCLKMAGVLPKENQVDRVD